MIAGPSNDSLKEGLRDLNDLRHGPDFWITSLNDQDAWEALRQECLQQNLLRAAASHELSQP